MVGFVVVLSGFVLEVVADMMAMQRVEGEGEVIVERVERRLMQVKKCCFEKCASGVGPRVPITKIDFVRLSTKHLIIFDNEI